MPPVPVDLSTLAFLGGNSGSPEVSFLFIALALALAAMRSRGRGRRRGPWGGGPGGGRRGGDGGGGRPSEDPPIQWDIRKSEETDKNAPPTEEHGSPSDL